MKILIIGGGNMGMTYARSFLRSHITNKDHMMILERSAQKVEEIKNSGLARVFQSPEGCLDQADLIILAVKPQDIQPLFKSLKGLAEPQQVFLSIMAGVKISTIKEGLQVSKVIRAMPNLPAQIGEGMTVFTSSEEVTRIELVMVQNLLNTSGKSIYVEKEASIDAATAISGSGPAYVFFFMQAMMQAATEMGFTESEAELLVGQTFKGAVDLFQQTEQSCKEWIDKVASKGGTTEAALDAWTHNQLNPSIMEGARAALKRAIELGKNK